MASRRCVALARTAVFILRGVECDGCLVEKRAEICEICECPIVRELPRLSVAFCGEFGVLSTGIARELRLEATIRSDCRDKSDQDGAGERD